MLVRVKGDAGRTTLVRFVQFFVVSKLAWSMRYTAETVPVMLKFTMFVFKTRSNERNAGCGETRFVAGEKLSKASPTFWFDGTFVSPVKKMRTKEMSAAGRLNDHGVAMPSPVNSIPACRCTCATTCVLLVNACTSHASARSMSIMKPLAADTDCEYVMIKADGGGESTEPLSVRKFVPIFWPGAGMLKVESLGGPQNALGLPPFFRLPAESPDNFRPQIES